MAGTSYSPPAARTGALQQFLRLEALAGVALVAAAAAGMVMANSPAAHLYEQLLETPVEILVVLFDRALFTGTGDRVSAQRDDGPATMG